MYHTNTRIQDINDEETGLCVCVCRCMGALNSLYALLNFSVKLKLRHKIKVYYDKKYTTEITLLWRNTIPRLYKIQSHNFLKAAKSENCVS